MLEESRDSVIDNWLRINSSISKLSLSILILGITNIIMIIFLIISFTKPPIVALTNGQDVKFYQGMSKDVIIQEGTIRRHIRKYVKLRYSWKNLNEESIAKSLEHLTTKGFNKKVNQELLKIRGQFKGNLTQKITNIEIFITKNKTVAKFDRVLRMDKIPLLIPTEISFRLVKGVSNKFNPSGLEIDGIVIHERK